MKPVHLALGIPSHGENVVTKCGERVRIKLTGRYSFDKREVTCERCKSSSPPGR